jgi:hypothetical protein
MNEEEDGEPDSRKGGEGKGWGIAVDDDWNVPFAIRIWKVSIYVALGLWP